MSDNSRDKSPTIRILGVMTGTSCDGLDAACIEIDEQGWSPVWTSSAPYPSALRKRALEFQAPGARFSARQWLELNRDLGDWYGQAISKIIDSQEVRPDLIANHGQTLAHFPESHGMGTTLQMGDATRIARATGLTVICQFRDGDMAAGGEGAPLAPRFHQVIAQAVDPNSRGIAIHNIGGISNLTYISPKGELLAFDTGPGNIWIDAATEAATRGRQKIDRGGKLALLGEVDHAVVAKALKHPYFKKPIPKSTGRDDFPIKSFLALSKKRDASLVATATAITAESIAHAYREFILKKGRPLSHVLVCGGGANNPTLLRWIEDRLDGIQVSPLSKSGIDGRWIEAQAFAYFGFLSLMGVPVGGSWTGARGFAPPGHVIPGENWQEVLSRTCEILT